MAPREIIRETKRGAVWSVAFGRERAYGRVGGNSGGGDDGGPKVKCLVFWCWVVLKRQMAEKEVNIILAECRTKMVWWLVVCGLWFMVCVGGGGGG